MKNTAISVMVILMMAIAVSALWGNEVISDVSVGDAKVRVTSSLSLDDETNISSGSLKLQYCNGSLDTYDRMIANYTAIVDSEDGLIMVILPRKLNIYYNDDGDAKYYYDDDPAGPPSANFYFAERYYIDTHSASGSGNHTIHTYTWGSNRSTSGNTLYEEFNQYLNSGSRMWLRPYSTTGAFTGEFMSDPQDDDQRNGTVHWADDGGVAGTGGYFSMGADLVASDNTVAECNVILNALTTTTISSTTTTIIPGETVITEGDHNYNVSLVLEYAPGAGSDYLAGVWPSDFELNENTQVLSREDIMMLLDVPSENQNKEFDASFTYKQTGTTPSQYLYLSAYDKNGSNIIRKVKPQYGNTTYSEKLYLVWKNSQVNACIRFVNFYDKSEELVDVNYSLRVTYTNGDTESYLPSVDQCHILSSPDSKIEVWATLEGYWDVNWKTVTDYYIPGEPLVVGMIPDLESAIQWNVTGYVMNSSEILPNAQVYATVIYQDNLLNDVLGPVLTDDTGFYRIEKIPDQTTFWLQVKESGHYTKVYDRIPASGNVYRNVTLDRQFSESSDREQWTGFVAKKPDGSLIETTLYCKAESSICDDREFTITPPFEAFVDLDLGCDYDICCQGTNYPRTCNPYTENPEQVLTYIPEVPETDAKCKLRGHVEYKTIDGNISYLEGDVKLIRDGAITMSGPTSENIPYEFSLRCDTEYQICFRYLERDACSKPLIVESINGIGTGLYQNLVIEESEFELSSNTSWFNLIVTNIGPMMGAFIFMTILFFGLAVMTKVIKEIQT